MRTIHAVIDHDPAVERALLEPASERAAIAPRTGAVGDAVVTDAHESIRWLRCELDVKSAYAEFLREQTRSLTHERREQDAVIASLQAEIIRLAPFERELLERRSMPRYRIADGVNAAVKRTPLVHALLKLGMSWCCRPKPRD